MLGEVLPVAWWCSTAWVQLGFRWRRSGVLLSLLLPVVSGRRAWALLVSVSLAPVSSCGNVRGGHGGAWWWQPPRFFSWSLCFPAPLGSLPAVLVWSVP